MQKRNSPRHRKIGAAFVAGSVKCFNRILCVRGGKYWSISIEQQVHLECFIYYTFTVGRAQFKREKKINLKMSISAHVFQLVSLTICLFC